MPRFFVEKNISEQSMMNILASYLVKLDASNLLVTWEGLTQKFYNCFPNVIYKDISKIIFDLENFTFGDFHDGIKFETLSNGLSVIWCCAGGDWESPVHFIVYHDGTRFRGYVPTNGNTFHKKSKCAYGSTPEEIDVDEDDEGPEPDYNLMRQDIVGRIQFKEGYVNPSKDIVQKLPTKAVKEDFTILNFKRKIRLD